MESLIIWFIILGIAIYSNTKKKNAKNDRQNRNPNTAQMQADAMRKQQELKNRLQQRYTGTMTGTSSQPAQQNATYRAPQQVGQQRPVQQGAAQQRPVQQRPVQQRPIQQRPVRQRPIQQGPVQQSPEQNDIMSRAVANAKVNEVDELERSQSAVAGKEASTDLCIMMGIVDVANSSELMARVNDLMITGYQADLSFERDFVAEGVEMLNGYAIPES